MKTSKSRCSTGSRPPLAAVLVTLLIGFALLLSSAGAVAEELPDPQAVGLTMRERLDALLERIKLEQQRLETLEADFIQDKESSLLLAPERATGTFSYHAPKQVRWEYAAPKPIVVVIEGDEMVTWFRDLGRAERMRVERYSEQVFKYLGASGSLETLMEYFALTVDFPESPGEPYHLDLLPRYARIAKRLESMELWIDPETFLPFRLRYEQPDGDNTEYRFENLRINGEIPEQRFDLELPAEVEVRQVKLGGKR